MAGQNNLQNLFRMIIAKSISSGSIVTALKFRSTSSEVVVADSSD